MPATAYCAHVSGQVRGGIQMGWGGGAMARAARGGRSGGLAQGKKRGVRPFLKGRRATQGGKGARGEGRSSLGMGRGQVGPPFRGRGNGYHVEVFLQFFTRDNQRTPGDNPPSRIPPFACLLDKENPSRDTHRGRPLAASSRAVIVISSPMPTLAKRRLSPPPPSLHRPPPHTHPPPGPCPFSVPRYLSVDDG